MTIDDIRVLVAADESRTLELKKSTGDDALKEALINSLCYRWWEQHNLTISLAIYDDRIEIASPGQFPRQITPETIKNPHDSYPYNPKIAEALYRTTCLENWGTGAKRIIEACREQGVEEPTWRREGGFIYVTFKRPSKSSLDRHVPLTGDDVPQNVAQSAGNAAQGIGDVALNVAQNTDDVAQSLDERILQIIKSNPTIKREDIANQLSVNKKTIERHLKDLGIKWEGHPKTGHWVIPDIKQQDNGKE